MKKIILVCALLLISGCGKETKYQIRTDDKNSAEMTAEEVKTFEDKIETFLNHSKQSDILTNKKVKVEAILKLEFPHEINYTAEFSIGENYISLLDISNTILQ